MQKVAVAAFLLHAGVNAHEEVEQVIYTCRLPCLRLGVRELTRAGTRKINGHAADFAEGERGRAREVKVGSRA